VYSIHRGELVVVPIRLVHRTSVSPSHEMMEVRLAHGVTLRITPRHPTADGRNFGDLARGNLLDGAQILSTRLVPYGEPFTYDILPDSDSGTYVAGGVLIGSALAEPTTGRRPAIDPLRAGRRASLLPSAPGRYLPKR
jgi:hypothetical protein